MGMRGWIRNIVWGGLGAVMAAGGARGADDGAVCAPMAKDERRSFDLGDVPLSEVVRVVACALDRNMLFQQPQLASKQVSFVGPKLLNRREILAAWHAMLLDHKLVEERRGGFFVIRAMR